MMNTIQTDLRKIREEYGVPRRTEIGDVEEAVFEEALPEEIPVETPAEETPMASTRGILEAAVLNASRMCS